jgi:hypothetical protein
MGDAISTKVQYAERPGKTFLPDSAAFNNEIWEFASSNFLGLQHKAIRRLFIRGEAKQDVTGRRV